MAAPAPARERQQAARDAVSSQETYLHAYLDDTGIISDPKGLLFRTVGRGTGQLSSTPFPQANAYAMVRRRALAAGIGTKIGNYMFRATGITAYLKSGGRLKTPPRWPVTRRRELRSFMTGAATHLPRRDRTNSYLPNTSTPEIET